MDVSAATLVYLIISGLAVIPAIAVYWGDRMRVARAHLESNRTFQIKEIWKVMEI